MSEPDSFLRQFAETRQFTLGAPRDFAVSADGQRILFLRSRGGRDHVNCLWEFDVSARRERLVLDPVTVGYTGEDSIGVAERSRRERARELAGGVVRFSADQSLSRCVAMVGSSCYRVDVVSGEVARLSTTRPAFDPRLDPTGLSVAYLSDGSLYVCSWEGNRERVLASSGSPYERWGEAEFVAAEEMGRMEGYWWDPDGTRLLVARTDDARVSRFYIADAADPAAAPHGFVYPFTGTENVRVDLYLVEVNGSTRSVEWRQNLYEYLVAVKWTNRGLILLVESRDQKRAAVLEVDPELGAVKTRFDYEDPVWVDVVPGVPALAPSGQLVTVANVRNTAHLVVDGQPVSPAGLEVREVLSVDQTGVLFSASTDSTEVQLWNWSYNKVLTQLTTAPGVHWAVRAGGTTVLTERTLESCRCTTSVLFASGERADIKSVSEVPAQNFAPLLYEAGPVKIKSALFLPEHYVPGGARLPVVMDPYGGAAAQKVVKDQRVLLVSQWLANQGFGVIVADGRGTPGRGSAWARSIRGDLLSLPLVDQITALQTALEICPDLDGSRVGIRGWSFGGVLAAAAVLRYPEVFKAAVAGAPDFDSRLYDTFSKEKYLGDPDDEPVAYDCSSLVAEAGGLSRPILLLHGTADDNVSIVHTYKFVDSAFRAGAPYELTVLPGVSHVRRDPITVMRSFALEAEFLVKSLMA